MTAAAMPGRLETLVDPDLTQFSADALLDELLTRSQKALAADTVVLLLLDRAARSSSLGQRAGSRTK